MKLISLMYHDVVGPEGFESSGFAGGDAHIYKLTRERFDRHMAALSATAPFPGLVTDVLARPADGTPCVVLTFDDGGVGALRHAAPALEAHGWRGHFFVTTDRIGQPGFVTEADVRELAARGHAIGSHTRTHPPRISHLPEPQIRAEWLDSVRRLADLVGDRIRTGSVPAGFYSDRVADAAADAGIEVLFTSEPTAAVARRGRCTILGRYAIMRDDDADVPQALARDSWLPQARQAALWKAKKAVKAIGGERWLAFRRRVLADR
ncbi:polysaccharide deacetylase [Gemmatirosa kalamazoonensis]|uniref:Polysaccharide deacetylase n=1 Tax=Gemmatirosa kalamazoonensis TaxID=861299 RepID=W0RI83_9BACT|nr:polysaccharide deacetylase family protein [Gemmatirosa kalamazoonensis]AHG90045.1 polysaccharide deacetylase [Gemmatirosa kalamazoonensis]